MSSVPPRDPRLCPALEVARPGDSEIFDGYQSERMPWLVLFGDGQWHQVEVRAWWRDRHGRRVAEIEWHIDGGTWSESYLVRPEKMREA